MSEPSEFWIKNKCLKFCKEKGISGVTAYTSLPYSFDKPAEATKFIEKSAYYKLKAERDLANRKLEKAISCLEEYSEQGMDSKRANRVINWHRNVHSKPVSAKELTNKMIKAPMADKGFAEKLSSVLQRHQESEELKKRPGKCTCETRKYLALSIPCDYCKIQHHGCSRCKDWQDQGLSDTCPACDLSSEVDGEGKK